MRPDGRSRRVPRPRAGSPCHVEVDVGDGGRSGAGLAGVMFGLGVVEVELMARGTAVVFGTADSAIGERAGDRGDGADAESGEVGVEGGLEIGVVVLGDGDVVSGCGFEVGPDVIGVRMIGGEQETLLKPLDDGGGGGVESDEASVRLRLAAGAGRCVRHDNPP
jgi:hypothetical protein